MLKTFRDKFLLEIVIFTSGALVMIYEIIGSRILAPYIGTSTYVWTEYYNSRALKTTEK